MILKERKQTRKKAYFLQESEFWDFSGFWGGFWTGLGARDICMTALYLLFFSSKLISFHVLLLFIYHCNDSELVYKQQKAKKA